MSRQILLILPFVLILLPGERLRTAEGHTPLALKTAFVYNFARFISWTDGSERSDNPLRIRVTPADAVQTVRASLAGKTVRGRPLLVEALPEAPEQADCHILFITTTDRSAARRALATVKGRSVLTVGHVPGFCQMGGIINFYMRGSTLRFEINRKAAERAGLRISSDLLRLARLVGEPDK